MKLTAVSQRVDVYPGRQETRDALDRLLTEFLLQASLLSVPVPSSLGERLGEWLDRIRPEMIVLSGGNDLGEDPQRDAVEWVLLEHAYMHAVPVLGICRGMQMMAHFAGVALRPVVGHIRTRHLVHGKICAEVNSYHAYSLQACPNGYEVLARSIDGEIEAIRHRVLPWEGWMWHPEREQPFVARDVERLIALTGLQSL
ncbi:gamma-glutamyl-gamma-aminobutyrate hydrolase family protein [Castellaniella caeni]|uniref:gamma-glutamyl-gamma-aminobutyrate hydrolase family protein n=1 Tax=Castellaniella caeni TaxID=266123 RepID=UPI000A06F641|nr:gamma-glutamyl-gamma-aminobutyrate hydrolase family protein [Castellaniella caeni]